MGVGTRRDRIFLSNDAWKEEKKQEITERNKVVPSYNQSELTLLPDGIYPFEAVAASEKTSQNGNVKIELTLEVGPDKMKVYDNLVFTKAAGWRIDAFRLATGDIIKGNTEVTVEAEDCIGRKGMCSIVTETYGGRTRNKVDAYLLPNAAPQSAASSGNPSAPSSSPPKLSEPDKNITRNAEGEPDDLTF